MSTKRTTKKAGTAAATKKTPKSSPAKKTSGRRPAKKAEPVKVAPQKARKKVDRDPRLPAIGTTITRHFKDRDLKIKVLADGFELDDKHFSSLSALAKHVVGYGVSGFAFVGLWKQAGDAAKESK